jgi:molybdopterin converting factor small subunit
VKITVRLFATFRDFHPTPSCPGPLTIDIEAHEDVRRLVRRLRLPDEFPRIILVNGQLTVEDRSLQEGDVVSIFPPLIGGDC